MKSHVTGPKTDMWFTLRTPFLLTCNLRATTCNVPPAQKDLRGFHPGDKTTLTATAEPTKGKHELETPRPTIPGRRASPDTLSRKHPPERHRRALGSHTSPVALLTFPSGPATEIRSSDACWGVTTRKAASTKRSHLTPQPLGRCQHRSSEDTPGRPQPLPHWSPLIPGAGGHLQVSETPPHLPSPPTRPSFGGGRSPAQRRPQLPATRVIRMTRGPQAAVWTTRCRITASTLRSRPQWEGRL
ncbi:uncharacterized protein LOC122236526 [Panthera tigris]|uniref:uncharacterized protein LOC122236526 n=1 Tax=Panthera tigris TaxID=9694 RepID=UPI001C6FA030|nr:uncharacterized protein LOC122236526 [Panthera tigris]